MLAYSHYVRKPRVSIYLLMLVGFALGLLSKPMVITLPFVLLLLDYWPLQRINLAEPRSWLKPVLEKLPLILLVAASSTITFLVQRHGGAVSTSLTVGQRVANAFVSYLRYTGKMFWPENLSILYPHPGDWPMSLVLTGMIFILGVTTAVLFLVRRKPYLAVGWFWFLGTAIPVIGLVQVGVQSMADRYTYIPLIGLFVMVTWGVVDLSVNWPQRTRNLSLAAGVVLAGCLLTAFNQEKYWKNSEALFQHAVNVTRNNYLAYNNLGYFLDHHGKNNEALENYQESLKINPNYEDALNNMGYALAGKGRYDEAIPYYERALSINPKLVEAHNNLGNALAEQGKVDEAIKHYVVALSLKPDHADAHNNFGIALAMQGRLDEAMEHLKESVRLKPSYASAHSNLGNAYAVQHKLEEAIVQYQLALKFKPDDAQAHNNIANVFSEQGKLAEAVDHYRAALRLRADNPEAHLNLGMALRRQGKTDEARTHYLEALRLKPGYAVAKSSWPKSLPLIRGRRRPDPLPIHDEHRPSFQIFASRQVRNPPRMPFAPGGNAGGVLARNAF